jgi:hypothetical protein
MFAYCSVQGLRMNFEWAGLSFLVLGRHDVQILRAPGVYALVRRDATGERRLLFVGHAASIAMAVRPGEPGWDEAMAAGFNEVHVFLQAPGRLDGLQIAGRVRRHCTTDEHPAARTSRGA